MKNDWETFFEIPKLSDRELLERIYKLLLGLLNGR